MDYSALYKQFSNEFWSHFQDSELAQGRKSATFQLWQNRTAATRKAMADFLTENDAPKDNPYFWVWHFPEPQPHNLNGARSLPAEPLVRAIHNGTGGIFTRAEAELFNMHILGDFTL